MWAVILSKLSQHHVTGDMQQQHTLETDALDLDYCISAPEVQLIQSQPVHSEHMHNGTTSEAMLCLSGMSLLRVASDVSL